MSQFIEQSSGQMVSASGNSTIFAYTATTSNLLYLSPGFHSVKPTATTPFQSWIPSVPLGMKKISRLLVNLIANALIGLGNQTIDIYDETAAVQLSRVVFVAASGLTLTDTTDYVVVPGNRLTCRVYGNATAGGGSATIIEVQTDFYP